MRHWRRRQEYGGESAHAGRLAPAAAFVVGMLALAPGSAWALSVQIRVNPPAPNGSAVEHGVSHTDARGAVSYEWDFGDGSQSGPSGSPTVTHQYSKPGHYPVIAFVSDATGTRSDSFLQAIFDPPGATRPTRSSSIVYDAERARVFNVNRDSDTVTASDARRLTKLWEVSVGDGPRALALIDGELWVVNEEAATISVLEPGQGATVANVALPRASRPYGIAAAPDGSAVYVTLRATGRLARIDPRSRAVRALVDVGPMPAGLAVTPDSKRVLITRFISPAQNGEVVLVDSAALDKPERLSLAVDPGPDSDESARGVPNYLMSVAISPTGTGAVVASKKDNILRGVARDGLPLTFETATRAILSFIDLGNNSELLERRIDFNNRALTAAAEYAPLGDYLFVATLGTNTVEVLDSYTGKSVAAGVTGLAPDGLVVAADGKLFVNNFLSRTLTVFDAGGVLDSTDFGLPRVAEIDTVANETLSPEVLRGKQIFYNAADTRMSRNGYISCAACHLDGFEDGRVWDFTDRGEGLRNTTSLLGRRGTGQGRLHWSANFDEIQDFENDIRFAFGGQGFMSEVDFASGTRGRTLGDRKAGLSTELDAIAEYVASLTEVHPSPYRTQSGTLTESAWSGRTYFMSLGCPRCHQGADFTDSASGALHDVGTIAASSGKRLGATLEGIDTPTLRGVWETAPYLHDGSAATLLDVLTTANRDDRHGATSMLPPGALTSLVDYLQQIDNVALEDERVPIVDLPDGGTTPPAENRPGCACHLGRAPTEDAASVVVLLGLGALALRRRQRRTTRE